MKIKEKIIDYFDLSKSITKRTTRDLKNNNSNYVLPQYFALTLGVFVQPFLENYQLHGEWGDTKSLLGRAIFGLIIGLAIFPSVYKRSWDNSKPIFVQLCAIFSAGLGWQTIFAAGSNIF